MTRDLPGGCCRLLSPQQAGSSRSQHPGPHVSRAEGLVGGKLVQERKAIACLMRSPGVARPGGERRD